MDITAWFNQPSKQKYAVGFAAPESSIEVFHGVKNHRLEWLDAIRGIAVILMVIFHFAYDLSYFGWYDEEVSSGSTWRPLRYIIMGFFICSMVFSLNLVHRHKRQWRRYLHWLIRVFAAAVLVSVATYFVYPNAWIYFGILHFMVASSVVVFLLMPFKWLSGICGIAIVVIYLLDYLPYGWPINYIKFLFHDGISVDYVEIFPWLGVALIAHSCALPVLKLKCLSSFLMLTPSGIRFLGRHSLGIYLIHQPVLFTLLYVLSISLE